MHGTMKLIYVIFIHAMQNMMRIYNIDTLQLIPDPFPRMFGEHILQSC